MTKTVFFHRKYTRDNVRFFIPSYLLSIICVYNHVPNEAGNIQPFSFRLKLVLLIELIPRLLYHIL